MKKKFEPQPHHHHRTTRMSKLPTARMTDPPKLLLQASINRSCREGKINRELSFGSTVASQALFRFSRFHRHEILNAHDSLATHLSNALQHFRSQTTRRKRPSVWHAWNLAYRIVLWSSRVPVLSDVMSSFHLPNSSAALALSIFWNPPHTLPPLEP